MSNSIGSAGTLVTTTEGEVIIQALSLNLMKGSFGNIKYYGANTNNYVIFNGETAG